MVIGVGNWDRTGVSCAAYNNDTSDASNPYIIAVDDWLTLSEVLVDFNTVICPSGKGSPYDSTFAQTTMKWNNRYIYESTESIMVFDGVNWNVLEDGTGTFM